MALPPGGRIVCCDISEEYTAVARRYWKEAGVEDRIDLRLGPATETLGRLLGRRARASQDLAFIDADKTGYDAYYEACLQLVRPGGIIAIDNVLWSGPGGGPGGDGCGHRRRSARSEPQDPGRPAGRRGGAHGG